jgi:hypothetical protein
MFLLFLQTNKEYKKYRIVMLSFPHEAGQVVTKHLLRRSRQNILSVVKINQVNALLRMALVALRPPQAETKAILNAIVCYVGFALVRVR